jgi:uncharacterized protein YkwD
MSQSARRLDTSHADHWIVFRGRWKGIVVACALVCALAAPASAAENASRSVTAADALERSVLAEVNALRARHHLAPLRLNMRLTAAADVHSRAMASRGFFAHESADGSAFWQRVRRFYNNRGFRQWSVGENLLWSSPRIEAAGALRMWLGSPAHRKNLLAREWREIGLSAVHVASAPGVYKGLEVTIVTADFGIRK